MQFLAGLFLRGRAGFLEDVQVLAGLGHHPLLRLQAHLQQGRPAVGHF